MSAIAEIIDTLEIKVEKLFEKMKVLEKSNLDLKEEIIRSSNIIKTQSDDFQALEKRYKTLKIANTLLGSDENKRDTRLKINSLIREIDYCIAQLSD
ncbi:chromosome segregation ATPase [Flavobacterium sp. PL11]|jgi:chromosome segregation ATPase|uniref:hypothetical protein n=1 Tax=Flavobacterium sp. PL11 TaxID=3071717 RepID=UPI002E039B27|nr:chromosome segregation ATPase [Flavobacterium sp. PL11]